MHKVASALIACQRLLMCHAHACGRWLFWREHLPFPTRPQVRAPVDRPDLRRPSGAWVKPVRRSWKAFLLMKSILNLNAPCAPVRFSVARVIERPMRCLEGTSA